MPVFDSASQSSEQQRDETPIERLDRNTIELLNELRVAGTGIQIMFAFLLVAPFNTGFQTRIAVRADRLRRDPGLCGAGRGAADGPLDPSPDPVSPGREGVSRLDGQPSGHRGHDLS
jgi:hypothetical protein